MANIKISQLPAKGANLASTDLVEISEFNGSGYVSKSITGQEIIDGASGGGVTDVTATAPLSSTGGSTPDIAITQAGAADDGYLSTGDWNAFNNKQDGLISGTNIKSLNGASLLGSGGLSVQPTLVSGTNIKTINGSDILGSGNLTISGGGGLQGVHALVNCPSGLGYGYTSAVTSLTSTASFNTNQNALILHPFIPARNITYTSLKINVATAAATCLTRILIYSDSNGLPSTKIYESTDLDCSTTGNKTVTITGTLTAGVTYWIGTHSSINCTLTGIPVGSALPIMTYIMTAAPTTSWNYAYGFNSAPTTLNQAQRNNSSGSLPLIQILP